MAQRFQVFSPAAVSTQELLANENCSVSYPLLGTVDNRQLFSISPQAGTLIPISGYQPQQLLLVGDGVQQQGLCSIAMAPVEQESQYVPQQLMFGAQPQSENGFYINTVPVDMAGSSWMYTDPKSQVSSGSLLHNLLQHPENAMVPVLERPNGSTSEQILVMLPTTEQQLIKLEVPHVAEDILPTMDHMTEDAAQEELLPVIKEVKSIHETKNGTRSPSPTGDVVVLEELKPLLTNYGKQDPLEGCKNKIPAAQVNGNTYVLASDICSPTVPAAAEEKFSQEQDVPRYLEVMAVCSHCGYTSMDFNRCQRCRRKLPPQVKTVPIPKNTTTTTSTTTSPVESKPSKTPVPFLIETATNSWKKPLIEGLSPPREKKTSRMSKATNPLPPSFTANVKAAVLQRAALEKLDAMAVCSYCGYTSTDIDQCERCRRLLPHDVKFVLSPKTSKRKCI